jgi:hypothetical protein
MKNGTKSGLQQNANATEQFFEPKDSEIRKISVYLYNTNSELLAIEMKDARDQTVFKAGYNSNCVSFAWYHIDLQPSERLLGMKAAFCDESRGLLKDPIFILGHLE